MPYVTAPGARGTSPRTRSRVLCAGGAVEEEACIFAKKKNVRDVSRLHRVLYVGNVVGVGLHKDCNLCMARPYVVCVVKNDVEYRMTCSKERAA